MESDGNFIESNLVVFTLLHMEIMEKLGMIWSAVVAYHGKGQVIGEWNQLVDPDIFETVNELVDKLNTVIKSVKGQTLKSMLDNEDDHNDKLPPS